jgi:hypothetical protein
LCVAAAVGCVALASMSGVATAHVASWDSEVKITSYVEGAQETENAAFLGKVRSERKACEDRRTVSVWKHNPGAIDVPVPGRARTNRSGIWVVSVPLGAYPGAYYASVQKRVSKSSGHKHVCKADRSPSFTVG